MNKALSLLEIVNEKLPFQVEVGKEFVFNRKMVKVIHVDKDKKEVLIDRIVRGKRAGEPEVVPLPMFKSRISQSHV